jgi:hypothetical protein
MANNILVSSLQLTTQMRNTTQVIHCGIRAVVNKDVTTVIYSAELCHLRISSLPPSPS